MLDVDDDYSLAEHTERPLGYCSTCKHERAMRRKRGLCDRAKKDALAESIWSRTREKCLAWEGGE